MNVIALLPVKDRNTIEKIAHEMHTLASQCKKMSLDEMKVQRLQFLHNNKNATAADLVNAIEMKIDGYDIITLLRSSDAEVCQKCADIITADYELGRDAVDWWCGGITLARAMQLGVLK